MAIVKLLIPKRRDELDIKGSDDERIVTWMASTLLLGFFSAGRYLGTV